VRWDELCRCRCTVQQTQKMSGDHGRRQKVVVHFLTGYSDERATGGFLCRHCIRLRWALRDIKAKRTKLLPVSAEI
jgi:hypothetical protein